MQKINPFFHKLSGLLTLILLGFCSQLNAALVTYTGSGTMATPGDWTVASNWDTGMVPAPTDDVVITGNVFVIIPAAATITVESVEIKSGADLIIDGTLNVGSDDGNDTNGALDLDSTSGTVTNNGIINAVNADENGIHVKGTFTNNGTININGTNDDGLFVTSSGSFINNADILITDVGDDHLVVASGTTSGVRRSSSFVNNGTIDIDAVGGDEAILVTNGSMFDNSGMIDIDISGSANDGIVVEYGLDDPFLPGTTPPERDFITTFTNAAAGTIDINMSSSTNGSSNGISMKGETATETVEFLNIGTLNITGDSGISEGSTNDLLAIQEWSTFNNSGNTTITNSGDHGAEVKANATWINSGIYKDVNSDGDGLQIDGMAINMGTLIIDITSITSDAIEVDQGTFDNTGGILESGCNDTTNEFEVRGDVDLGTSCFVFDITGDSAGSDEFDQLDIQSGSTVDISGVTAKLEWNYPDYEVGDCFKIVDGGGMITGEFASIVSSDPSIVFSIEYTPGNPFTGAEVEICILPPCDLEVDCSNVTDQDLECIADLPPVDFDLVIATDSCGAITRTESTITNLGTTGCPGDPTIITRTYFLEDTEGNMEECMQTFTVESTIAPTVTCPANVTIACDADTSPANTGMATGTASCSAAVITFSDVSTQGTGCSASNFTITRTWTSTDACNRMTSCDQIITVVDSSPAVITCPADVTVECDQSTDPAATGMATATGDNCAADADLVITFTDVSTQGAAGCDQFEFMITRTWTATDPCGNATSCDQIITVESTTPSVITCPANVTIACDADTSPANTGMATATASCSDAVVSFTDVSTQTTTGCGQYTYMITRTWTATDVCGNASSCDQVITVEDTTGPAITCPDDQSLVCNTDPLPTAMNITDFMAIGGAASDNCASASELTVTFLDSPTNQSQLDFCSANAADRTLTRTYIVTDACGNSSTCAQSFVYDQSVLDPVITNFPPDQTVDCAVNAFPQPHLFTVDTDCGLGQTITVSSPNNNGTPGCPGSTIQYTYTSTDICGRSVSHTQTYTLANEGPEFVCPVDICVIDCPADNDMIQAQFDDYANLATVITSCSESDVTITNTFNPNFFIPQNCSNPTVAIDGVVAYQTVTFRATDFCGRSATCTALVVIKDSDGPVMNGNVPLGVADCATPDKQPGYDAWIALALSNLSAMDECSGSPVSITHSPLSPNNNCQGGVTTTNVTFTATDACGNETVINATYRIIDYGTIPMAMVSGSLMTEENQPVELVEVSVDGGMSNMMMTGADGDYGFDLETNQNYNITPSRDDDHLNGISSYDVILLGRHILEIQELDSPYKLIAADVNNSGTISTLDLIQLRRLILHIDETFTNNTSWRFVDANYVFPNIANPFATTFPEAVSINNLSQAELHDFMAIKIGDLNGSVVPTLLGEGGDTRDREQLIFQVEDQQLTADQTYTVDFKAKDFNDILGYQFTLAFDPSQLEMVDFTAGALENLSAENFGDRFKEGVLTSSWNVFEAVSIADDATLFSITFKVNANVNLSNAIQFNSELTSSEAYSQETSLNLGLEFNQSKLDELVVYQNQPNPIKAETTIGFSLPEASTATLTIYDVTGRIVKTIEGDYAAGYHAVEINSGDLGGNGIWYYRFDSGNQTITKKMIMIK